VASTSRFSACLAVILKLEGGYADIPEDRGGPTNCGITQSTYDSYRSRQGLPTQPVLHISPAEMADIYQTGYWQPAQCDSLPAPLDLCVFDMAVNSGVSASIKTLQGALGIGADGLFGSQTAAAVAQCDPTSLAADFETAHEAFYRSIVARNPSQQVFLAGWLNRITAIKLAGNITDD
jgi:lysozyme family protein